MIGNIKETFPTKNWYVLQYPGYIEGVKSACCMVHAMLPGCIKYPMLKESKEIKNTHNTLDLRYLSHVKVVKSPFDIHCVTAVFLMLKELKVHLIYNVDSNTKSSNYIKIRLKGLIYFEFKQTLN